MTEENNVRKCKVCEKQSASKIVKTLRIEWECWDDQLTEESDSMYDELM